MQIKITNPNDLKKYLQTKKENIKNNLIDFYKIKDIEFQRLDKIEKILSFSGETEYELFYINSIIENIPFKYFDIQINNEKYGKIIYNFDLVKEVMGELYELLIYTEFDEDTALDFKFYIKIYLIILASTKYLIQIY